jgi:spore coat protein U-like protein
MPITGYAAQCNVVTSAMSFGAYDPLAATPADTTTTIGISCRTKKPQIVTIQVSGGNSGTPAMRNLLNGGSVLVYNLFSNPGRSQVIGDGTGGSTTLTRTVDRNNPWDLTLYGRIPALQVIPAGLYSDSLVATILW